MIFRGIDQLWTFQGVAAKDGRRVTWDDLAPIRKAALVCDKGRITWIGPERKLPRTLVKKDHKDIDLGGVQVLPGLVECHSHLVFAGHRADEFEWRNTGVSYQDIAARGGGILSTMNKTRKASATTLTEIAQGRVDDFVRQGVTTLEVKSGYALNAKDELKCLRVVKNLKGPRLVPTFLGAHAKPPEFETTESYLQFLADQVLPVLQRENLATRVDIFVEKGFFETAAARTYLQTAQKMGFQLVVHADQLSLSGGTQLGIELGAVSVDHVICLDELGIQRLASSRTTAVLLPAADLYMRCSYPSARKLIDAGGRVALATDFNPGTSPTMDTQLVGVLARLEMKMTLPEVLAAYTYGAAAALGLQSEVGSLQVGKRADFFCTGIDIDEHFLSIGRQVAQATYASTRKIY